MSKLDDAIHGALSQEDAEFLARYQREPSAVSQLGGLFSGPLSWFNVMLLVVAMIVGVGAVYAGWRFAIATELRALAHWGALTALGLLVITVVRLWFFMELQSNRIIREIKRVELQVAYLAQRKG